MGSGGYKMSERRVGRREKDGEIKVGVEEGEGEGERAHEYE